MTQLLVSVRSAAECRQAIEAGVDVIDLKEPLRGSLGAPDPEVVREVAEVLAGRCPLSVALGELLGEHNGGAGHGNAAWQDLPSPVGYAKYGLSGSASDPHWSEVWEAAVARLPSSTVPVAVAYVDRGPARCVPWQSVLAEGARLGCGVLLLDTFGKDRGGLRTWMNDAELLIVREATSAQGLKLALAGSLQLEDLAALSSIRPDLVAVRSAVCEGHRTGSLSPSRLSAVRAALHAFTVA